MTATTKGLWEIHESHNGDRCDLCGGHFMRVWAYRVGIVSTMHVCGTCAEKTLTREPA